MQILHAIFLGAVQGVTEFLPISSSAHLVLVPWLFKWRDPGLAFDVFLHLGTLGAICLYFAKDWWAISRAGIASIVERRLGFERDRILFWQIMLATIPAGLSGLFFHEHAETIFRDPLLIAVTLAAVGFLIYWIDGRYPALRRIDEIRMKDALWIGLAQAFSIIPGVSRSGSTMAMARLRGVSREGAARFSFLLSFPIILAACVFEGRDFMEQLGGELALDYCMAGFVSSLLFGLMSIHFLLLYLRNADFKIFAWYRLLLAGVVVVISMIS